MRDFTLIDLLSPTSRKEMEKLYRVETLQQQGVYVIINKTDRKRYIGKSKNIYKSLIRLMSAHNINKAKISTDIKQHGYDHFEIVFFFTDQIGKSKTCLVNHYKMNGMKLY